MGAYPLNPFASYDKIKNAPKFFLLSLNAIIFREVIVNEGKNLYYITCSRSLLFTHNSERALVKMTGKIVRIYALMMQMS